MKTKIEKISVIIPTKNFFNIFVKTFNSLFNQTILPSEIVIVDSSDDDKIQNFVNRTKNEIDNININYIKVKHAFPRGSKE